MFSCSPVLWCAASVVQGPQLTKADSGCRRGEPLPPRNQFVTYVVIAWAESAPIDHLVSRGAYACPPAAAPPDLDYQVDGVDGRVLEQEDPGGDDLCPRGKLSRTSEPPSSQAGVPNHLLRDSPTRPRPICQHRSPRRLLAIWLWAWGTLSCTGPAGGQQVGDPNGSAVPATTLAACPFVSEQRLSLLAGSDMLLRAASPWACSFESPARGTLVDLLITSDPILHEETRSTFDGGLAVAGLGDEAYWALDVRILSVLAGDHTIQVRLGGSESRDDDLDLASAVVREAISQVGR